MVSLLVDVVIACKWSLRMVLQRVRSGDVVNKMARRRGPDRRYGLRFGQAMLVEAGYRPWIVDNILAWRHGLQCVEPQRLRAFGAFGNDRKVKSLKIQNADCHFPCVAVRTRGESLCR